MRRKRREMMIAKLHRTVVMVAGAIGALMFLIGASAFDSDSKIPGVLVVLGIGALSIVALHSNSMYWGDEDDDF